MHASLQQPPFEILAIVASAGGLEAISPLLTDLPADFSCAVLVGQHLGSTSTLVEILQRRTRLEVHWMQEGERLRPGCIHVAPPHTQVEVLPDSTFAISRVAGETLRVKPLDALLRSVAEASAGAPWPLC